MSKTDATAYEQLIADLQEASAKNSDLAGRALAAIAAHKYLVAVGVPKHLLVPLLRAGANLLDLDSFLWDKVTHKSGPRVRPPGMSAALAAMAAAVTVIHKGDGVSVPEATHRVAKACGVDGKEITKVRAAIQRHTVESWVCKLYKKYVDGLPRDGGLTALLAQAGETYRLYL
jgi:hypothetical protein